MVGLGRMGGNMARRLAASGIDIAAFDASDAARSALSADGRVETVADLPVLVAALPAPRIVWLMLPAGKISELSEADQ
ncbi:MAG: NAD(P)-binding domain-containing protein [Casimicrobiaceae bacterium]